MRRTFARLTAVVLCLAVGLTGCQSKAQRLPGGEVSVGADQEPTRFNPNAAADALFWLDQIMAGVLPSVHRVDPSFELVADRELVDSVRVTSTTPQTVVYRISDRAKWSDGRPITADDFVYLWENCNGSRPDSGCESSAGYEDIERITGSNGGKTVTVVFRKPFADWKSLFGVGSSLLPAHVMRNLAGGFESALVGAPTFSGSHFRIAEHRRGESLTLVRNERYWGEPAKLDRVVFRFVTPGGERRALAEGQAEIVFPEGLPDVADALRSVPQARVDAALGPAFEQLTFNFRNEHLADVRVRRALAKALDRRRIVADSTGRVAPEAAVLGNRMWLVGQAPYRDHGERAGYDASDPDATARLLGEAGYARGDDGVWARDGRRLALRLLTSSGDPYREQEAALIRDQLAAVGVEVNVQPVLASELIGARLPAGDFDLAVFAWVGSAFPVTSFRPVYASGAPTNYGAYANGEVDRLLQQAAGELDEAKYADLLNQADERMWDDLPNVPLSQRPTLLATRGPLTGIVNNAVAGPAWNIERWGREGGRGDGG